MGKHYVSIVYFFIPCSTDKPIKIKGRKRTQYFFYRQLALIDKHCFTVFHIAKAYVLNICAQGFNSGFCSFTRTEISTPYVPGCANSGR